MSKRNGKGGGDQGGGFDLFGGVFDFDRDGKTSLWESWVGYQIMEEGNKRTAPFGRYSPSKPPPSRYQWRETCEDGSEFDVDPRDFETEEAYNDALEEAKYGWRETCEDGSEFDVDPGDFETEDEYNEALEEARYAWRGDYEERENFGLSPFAYDTEAEYKAALSSAWTAFYTALEESARKKNDPDEAEADPDEEEPIRPEDYPNRRKYLAARELYCIEDGTMIYGQESRKRATVARCRFILESPHILAANYLTHEGDFLYAQAVKEHFTLPIPLEDEDERVEHYINDVIEAVAEEDAPLAVEIWLWCIEQFRPYWHYGIDADDLVSGVLGGLVDLPEGFTQALLDAITGNVPLMDILATAGKDSTYAMVYLVYHLLRRNDSITAKELLQAYLRDGLPTEKTICELTGWMISDCANYEELETMERFRQHIFPIIAGLQLPRVQRDLEKWESAIRDYIDEEERTDEQYAYTRRYAWRANCQDGAAYDIDPLDYETEAEYDEAIREEKYGWRQWCAEGEACGLDPADYETEAEYRSALSKAYRQRNEQRLREAKSAGEKPRRERESDPLAACDRTIYTYCAVLLSSGGTPYHYRTEDDTLAIGDKVVVPVGRDGKETVGEIVSVEKHRRLTVPYPVEQTKFIKGRYEEG